MKKLVIFQLFKDDIMPQKVLKLPHSAGEEWSVVGGRGVAQPRQVIRKRSGAGGRTHL